MQYFKGDETELKMVAIPETFLGLAEIDKDSFLADCYSVPQLGEIISVDNRSPLANAIILSIFRTSFNEIFQAFIQVGAFESYLTVFRKIFGETVDVTFTVPAAGKLEINIVSSGIELSNFITRYIEDNAYVFDTIVDDVGDNIVFQSIKGFQTQYELEKMLFEMVPAGVFTDINLTIA
jgi:hypothetical protein